MMEKRVVEKLLDYELVGTPFRGLVIRTPFALCAYIGVPKNHWIANMPELQFRCHWGVTFSGEGDGIARPKDFYWYGWDYGHAGDAIDLSAEIKVDMPAEVIEMLEKINSIGFFGKPAKKWTLAEVEQDLLDAAMGLAETIETARETAISISNGKINS
jgi:hypothetical protein